MLFERPYALVLSGGGAKGAYQIGAWKAFRKLGLKFNAVIGTSVGALNGALIVQGSFRLALDMWNNIRLEKIITIPEEFIRDGEISINQKNISYLKEVRDHVMKHGGLDTAPLKKLIDTHVNEKKIRNSGVDFGIVAYELSGLRPLELFLRSIPAGELGQYLLASSALPGFQTAKVNDRQFVDGGVYDNIPFALAKRRGYRRMIIVDVSGLGINRKPEVQGTETVYIKNSIDMGNIFEFTQEFIRAYMRLGYLDTLRVFGRLDGVYYFYPLDVAGLRRLGRILFSGPAYRDYRRFLTVSAGKTPSVATPEEAVARMRTFLPDDLRDNRSIAMAMVEYAARTHGLERNRLYSFRELLKELWKKMNEADSLKLERSRTMAGWWDKIVGKSPENAMIPVKVLYSVLKIYFGS